MTRIFRRVDGWIGGTSTVRELESVKWDHASVSEGVPARDNVIARPRRGCCLKLLVAGKETEPEL
jgi:hypothetical protein